MSGRLRCESKSATHRNRAARRKWVWPPSQRCDLLTERPGQNRGQACFATYFRKWFGNLSLITGFCFGKTVSQRLCDTRNLLVASQPRKIVKSEAEDRRKKNLSYSSFRAAIGPFGAGKMARASHVCPASKTRLGLSLLLCDSRLRARVFLFWASVHAQGVHVASW